MVRVLHVINQFSDRAGAEVSLREFLLASHEESVDHGVAVLTRENNDFACLSGTGIPTFVPRRHDPGWVGKAVHVAGAIRAFDPDIVHTALFDADLTGRLVGRLMGRAAVTTLVNMPWASHGTADQLGERIKLSAVRGVERLLAHHATTQFHAVATAVADASAEAFGVGPEAFTVVHRGRGAERLGRRTIERRMAVRQRLQSELGRSIAGPVVLAVGREEPQKDHRLLLESVALLRRRHPDVLVLLAGRRGASSGSIDRLLEDPELAACVVRLGARKDVPDLLAAADVLGFPSLYEGAAGAVIEAMALELPVVATDTPALQEVLDGGRCGTLVPLGEPDELASALERCIRREPDVGVQVAAARHRFEEEYELEAVSRAMLRFYEDVLSARRA